MREEESNQICDGSHEQPQRTEVFSLAIATDLSRSLSLSLSSLLTIERDERRRTFRELLARSEISRSLQNQLCPIESISPQRFERVKRCNGAHLAVNPRPLSRSPRANLSDMNIFELFRVLETSFMLELKASTRSLAGFKTTQKMREIILEIVRELVV